MYQDYPMFPPGQGAQRAVRLQLAALIACVEYNGFNFPKSELAPYFLPEKEEDDGTKVHGFTWIPPTGALGRSVEQVAASICRSILRKEIQPLLLVISVEDEIDPFNTWLKAEDFQLWCEQRLIALGDLWDRLIDEVDYIELAAVHAAAAEMDSLESLHREHLAAQDWWGTLNPAIQDKVLAYIADHEPSPSEQQPDDHEKPLRPRERNTHLNTIGALLELLLEHYGNKQDAIIAAINRRFSDTPGLSQSNLTRLFPTAKAAIARKD